MADATTTIKYAHTKAFIAQLAQEYPNYDTPGGTLQDAEDGGSPKANADLVRKVVRLLEEEDEEALKSLIKRTFSIDESDPALLEQVILDLMHKHKDDLQGVPFVFLGPMKRPISRPSSRASTHSYRVPRPDTPSSPLVKSLSLRRPHTPVASPLSAGLHAPPGILTGNLNGFVASSPGTSPTTANMGPISTHFANTHTNSQPGSPITSPAFLNAKAVEFRPTARPGSAMSGTFSAGGGGGRTDTPSPDMWAHRPNDIVPNSPRRVSSSLAIASPLGLDSYFPRPSSLTRSNSGLRKSIRRNADGDEGDDATAFKRVDDDDHDEFSPFSKAPPMNMPKSTTNTHLNQFKDEPLSYPYPAHLQSSLSQDNLDDGSSNGHSSYNQQSPLALEPQDPTGMASDGMTPFEVLHSVFGSTVPPSTLEEALNKNGYDFEASMAWLIDHLHGTPTRSTSSPVPSKPAIPVPGSGGRVMTVSRDVVPNMRPGAAAAATTADPRYFGQRVAVATGGRVCRYYLAGECRRSDCRFSHDIERALCRFWLRGQCMKGEQCEFLHTLPQDIDIAPLTGAMAQTDLNSEKQNGPDSPPLDAFPSLRAVPGAAASPSARGGYDPSRTRFAAAVKKQPTAPTAPTSSNAQRSAPVLGVRRIAGDRSSPATPRPSPRLKLRPPSLLPTLPTGKVMNELYMSYRSKAIEHGAQRNVALTRAAEAWKRGDGATAKHWSRQAHELNSKMGKEMAEAAGKLVKERARSALEAVMGRETTWSDDPLDRGTRGKVAGAGLGVLLGVASASVGGVGVAGANLSSEERTESLLDLHGLHSSEGVEVLEEYLLALEREHFFGLAYVVVGEEKHTGTQDPARGASRMRLAAGVKDFLHRWQYPWNERDGVVCIDPLTHAS